MYELEGGRGGSTFLGCTCAFKDKRDLLFFNITNERLRNWKLVSGDVKQLATIWCRTNRKRLKYHGKEITKLTFQASALRGHFPIR